MKTDKAIVRTVEATVELSFYLEKKDTVETSLRTQWESLFGTNDAEWKFRIMNPRKGWVRIICERYAGR